ncbi:MAG: CBS domain-containing protein [Thermodesulfobacteriota bacterium]|nr:CBS domain-containing protein [Thermodesulfobacteriota bacterium]
MAGADKKEIFARDVMNTKIVTIDGLATAREAVEKMHTENVCELIVNKRSPDDAWGILVYQDIVRGVVLTDLTPDEVNVYELMTKPVITVPADMNIRYAARLIYNAGVRRAPVEENGELVGIITMASLVLGNKLF